MGQAAVAYQPKYEVASMRFSVFFDQGSEKMRSLFGRSVYDDLDMEFCSSARNDMWRPFQCERSIIRLQRYDLFEFFDGFVCRGLHFFVVVAAD